MERKTLKTFLLWMLAGIVILLVLIILFTNDFLVRRESNQVVEAERALIISRFVLVNGSLNIPRAETQRRKVTFQMLSWLSSFLCVKQACVHTSFDDYTLFPGSYHSMDFFRSKYGNELYDLIDAFFDGID